MGTEYVELITKLIELHGRPLAELAYRCTGSRELAEDLVQETWLVAWCKIELVSRHRNPAAWLYKTMWNLARRELAKAYHSELALDETVLGGKCDGLPMEHFLPDGLCEKERELILMRIDRQMSFAEIAEAKGITENACRQQVSRAIRKCRKLLEKALDT